ncbi:MAG: chemotaxis protein CheX [Candidatus Omnitrophota bacterium]
MQEDQMKKLLAASVEETFMVTFNEVPEIIYFDNFDDMEEECVISSIGFTGTLEGTCALCLPDSSACAIVSRMTNQKVTEVNVDIIDGIGELVNIILGGIKMKLEGTEFALNISVPSCIKGSRMVVLTDIKKTTSINVRYQFNNAQFAISLMYKISPKENADTKKKLALERLRNLGLKK